MAAKNDAPQRLIVGPWSHVGMRGDVDLHARRRLRPRLALGRAALLRRAARRTSTAGSATTASRAAGWARRQPVRIFVMGGGSGRKTPLGKLDHGGRWRDEDEWPLARARADDLPPPRRRVAAARAAGGRRRAAALHLRPRGSGADDRRPLLRRRRVPVRGERTSSRCGRGCSTRRCRLRNIMTPGPADQKESAEYFTAKRAVPAAVGAPRRARLPDRAARRRRSR